MPKQPATNTLDAEGRCDECGKLHNDRHGNVSCAGHVRYDRASYVPGQDRKPLPEPRPCARPPVKGTTRCPVHGVNCATKKAGERRVSEDKVTQLATRWAIPIDTTPTDAILGRVSAFAGHVRFYSDKVAELDEAELVWGRTKETDGHVVVGNGPSAYVDSNTDETREAKPNAWLTLYNEASEKLVKFAAEALRAGIEERRVRLAESQGALVAEVIRAVLSDLDLTAEQTAKATEAVPARLRLLAS